jgi:hypothetical protein
VQLCEHEGFENRSGHVVVQNVRRGCIPSLSRVTSDGFVECVGVPASAGLDRLKAGLQTGALALLVFAANLHQFGQTGNAPFPTGAVP